MGKTDKTAAAQEVKELRKEMQALQKAYDLAEKELDKNRRMLKERIKELNCLKEVSHLVTDPDSTLESIFAALPILIQQGMQYPGITNVRIIYNGTEYKTDSFRRSKHCLSAAVHAEGEPAGSLEVYYQRKMPEADEGPFLKEERELINTLAEKCGRIIERFTRSEQMDIQWQQLENLFDGIDDVIYVSDPDTYELLYVNTAAKNTWGDITGQKCYAALQGRSEPCDFCTNHIIFDEKPGQTHVWDFKNEVNQHWYRCADKAIEWPNGKKVRMELASDISEQKESALSLQDYKDRFSAFLANTDDLVTQVSADGKFLFVNQTAEKILGLKPDECIGKSAFDFIHPDDQQRTMENFQAWLAEKATSASFENRQKSINGKVTEVLWTINPRYTNDGELDCIWSVARDISSLKQVELAMQKLNADLKRSNEELEQFAYVASHDLQEPLRMVASYTQLLGKRYNDQLDDNARDFIHYAVDGANRMQQLINDLLAYSRIETRGRQLEPVDLHEVLGRVIADMQITIEESRAIITNDELPLVMGDRIQLQQLLQNLISNGIKFRGGQAPRIHIKARKKAGKHIITVEDNGIGFDPQYAERVFQVFQRLHTKTEYPGTGIGLAICKRIAERHRGSIRVESVPGQGSTFIITLQGA